MRLHARPVGDRLELLELDVEPVRDGIGARSDERVATCDVAPIDAGQAHGHPLARVGPLDVPVVHLHASHPHGSAGRLDTKEDGFARRCRTGETGVLLARVDPDTMPGGESPLRGVFARDDAWVSTGDLFRTDEDGDLWLVDPLAVLVKTQHGPVPPSHAARALQELEAVDLVVAYGVPAGLLAATTGRRSVISTESLALQAQVIDKDAPVIVEAVKAATGVEVTFEVLKGWSNWACMRSTLGTAHHLLGEQIDTGDWVPTDDDIDALCDRLAGGLGDPTVVRLDGCATAPRGELVALIGTRA